MFNVNFRIFLKYINNSCTDIQVKLHQHISNDYKENEQSNKSFKI